MVKILKLRIRTLPTFTPPQAMGGEAIMFSLSWCPVPTSAFFSLRTNTWWILMKPAGGDHCHQLTDQLVTFWAKLYQGQGSRIRQKIRIDVKPVLPRSRRLHKFHSTYGILRLQGWRVHYTHAVADVDHVTACCLYLSSLILDVPLCTVNNA